MTELHPLLERLLKKVGATTGEAPSDEAWRSLLALVSRTYHDNDQDRYTLERSIDISSREMQTLYRDLERRTATELSAERHRVEEGEAILLATLEATRDGMLVVSPDRRVLAWNDRFTQMMGISDELMQTRDHTKILAAVSKLFAEPDRMMAAAEALHATTQSSQQQARMLDGRVIDRYSAPVRLPSGEIVGRVTYMRDITVERAATEALENARQAAVTASNAKSMFLANMSHELRTPLNAVIGLADLLLLDQGDPLTKRQREYLEGIATSGHHLLAMVNDVLDLAKIEAGKGVIEPEPVATQAAVEEAVQLLQTIATQRGVTLTANVDPAVPYVRADPVRLRQILYNLISNALKFTEPSGRVDVSAEAATMGVAIRVSDTGIGIAAADLQRLFRPFEQANLPSGDRPGGTGLGLALTKRLVDMHGGSIEVMSTVGAGTTFTVRLPVA